MTEGSQQQISFETPGAVGALCDIRIGVNGLRYIVRPPQTVWIKKSARDMTVTCQAPGNRIVTETVESEAAPSTLLNIGNGALPGAVYDAESGAMFKYPELISIDFVGVMPVANAMPDYHNLDALDPQNEATIENMGPDSPALAADAELTLRHKMAELKAAQEEAEAAAMALEKQKRIDSLDGGFYGDKGNK